MTGSYENTKSDETVECAKCSNKIERGTMFIEHTLDDGKKEVICHSCFYEMKKNNQL